jgi:hypothetical protein
MMTSAGSAETSRYREYARGRLEEALFILDTGSDIEILGAAELALMALRMECGSPEPIMLNPEEIDDVMAEEAEPGPACICPPDLLERGGHRGGCPVHSFF